MVEVAATDAFVAWYETISVTEALAIEHAVAHIELQGSTYGQISHRIGLDDEVRLHQLRVPSEGHPGNPISLCYASDALGRFVLLLSGGTDGAADLCDGLVASAEKLWRDYLRSTTNGHGDIGSHRPT
jgi:hypothetical protein